MNFQRKTDLCILVDKDSPVEKVADLKGKTVVVFAASPWAPFIDLYLKSGGMNRETVKVEFVDPAALWGTYTAKRADGLMSTVGSALPVAEKPRPSKCLLGSDAGITFPAYGLVARDDTIKNKSEALKKLVKVQQRAWEHLRTNVDDGVKAMINQRPDAKLNPEVLAGQIKLTIDYFDTPATAGKPLGWQAKSDWEAALKSMEEAGVVKAGWNADDFFTNDLVQ
jgi:NitT/TauT family transport system substrate-binding protein